jgi:hypothetical protein
MWRTQRDGNCSANQFIRKLIAQSSMNEIAEENNNPPPPTIGLFPKHCEHMYFLFDEEVTFYNYPWAYQC